MKRLLILLWCCCLPAIGHATPLIADISSHRIEIHSGFTGTQILLFGARNDPGDIVAIIRGPQQDMILRKKERTAGIWINRVEERFPAVPHFYAIASSRPFAQVPQFLLFPALGIESAEATIDEPFRAALSRILMESELYAPMNGSIEFIGETLFKATFNFPDNMPRGTYSAEVYLLSGGMLSGLQVIPIEVVKTGFDAFLYEAAHEHGFLYGLFAVLLALGVGGFANWLFQRL